MKLRNILRQGQIVRAGALHLQRVTGSPDE
jgi:hypothetical protein